MKMHRENNETSAGWETKFHGFFTLLHFMAAFLYHLFKDIYIGIVLEDGSILLWDQRQICVLSRIIKIMTPSKSKLGRFAGSSHRKAGDCVAPELLSCGTNLLWLQWLPGSLNCPHGLVGGWEQIWMWSSCCLKGHEFKKIHCLQHWSLLSSCVITFTKLCRLSC